MEDKGRMKIIDRDTMKYIAIITMFIGHAVAWIDLMQHPGDDYATFKLPIGLMIVSFLSLICPPVMFFFIADGYKYTRDRKKYALRLFIFACITQPFDWLIFQPLNGWRTANVIFTLFFGLLSIIIWESSLKLWQRIALIVACDAVTVLISSAWMLFGPLFILFLHIYRDKPKQRLIAYSILTGLHFIPDLFSLGQVPTANLLIGVAVMISMFVLAYFAMTVLYNGKKGKHPVFAKWSFYVFYPLHYLIIWAIAKCVIK
ncbi:MAG: hypothetical protein IKR73_02250 [Oscillospiraceae bacterium]|nr:hypothetical protein [Oscillospiraceae bacterium]